MWIFLSDSFLSIVAHRFDQKALLVRARVRGDIERVFPKAKVTRTPDADYRYRATILRNEVAAVIAANVTGIQYPNFKGSVRERDRLSTYHDVWDVMFGFQHRQAQLEDLWHGPELRSGQRWLQPRGGKEVDVVSVQDRVGAEPEATLLYRASRRMFRLPLSTARRWLRHATNTRNTK